jgi:hypothetical protein
MDNVPTNPYYPDATAADFESFYTAETSDIPWQTFSNCSVCGRISQKISAEFAKEVCVYDPYRQKKLFFLVCSPPCETIARQQHKE